MLLAMADQRIRDLGVHLIIAGEYYSKDVEATNNKIIADNNLHDTVHLFTDFIPEREVCYYFSAADVVAQPYTKATQSGITQIAYHFEKPMIVTNVGGLPEVVPDGKVGFVADPDPTSVADAILRFYQPDSLPDLAQNMQAEKRKYSWEIFTQAMLKVVGM